MLFASARLHKALLRQPQQTETYLSYGSAPVTQGVQNAHLYLLAPLTACRFQLQEERKRLVEEAKRLVERMEEMERQERIAAMTQRHASPDRLRTHTFHTTTCTVASTQLHGSRETSPSIMGLSSPFQDATLTATSPRAGTQGAPSHMPDLLA